LHEVAQLFGGHERTVLEHLVRGQQVAEHDEDPGQRLENDEDDAHDPAEVEAHGQGPALADRARRDAGDDEDRHRGGDDREEDHERSHGVVGVVGQGDEDRGQRLEEVADEDDDVDVRRQVLKDPLNPHDSALAFVLGVLDGVMGDIEQRRVHSRQDGGDDQTQGRTEEIGEHSQTSEGVGMSVRPLERAAEKVSSRWRWGANVSSRSSGVPWSYPSRWRKPCTVSNRISSIAEWPAASAWARATSGQMMISPIWPSVGWSGSPRWSWSMGKDMTSVGPSRSIQVTWSSDMAAESTMVTASSAPGCMWRARPRYSVRATTSSRSTSASVSLRISVFIRNSPTGRRRRRSS